jgi:cystathionine gamma-synthase
MKFETLAVHAGGQPDPATGAIATPIHLSTTFRHGADGTLEAGFEYVREHNPNQARLEEALAAIEGGSQALIFASGMAAASALLQSLPLGSHVVLPTDVYHGMRVLAREFLSEQVIASTAVDMIDLDALRGAMKSNTRCIWIETPSNPLLEVTDIEAVVAIAREFGAIVAVDNTFATPVLQQPLALGADVVMHSTTKYLSGHSDAMGGALVFRNADSFADKVRRRRQILGAVMAPFNAWLTLRGLRSLSCRMERHCRNALAVAQFLSTHPAVEWVNFPGLAVHPGHAVAKRQMRDFGGMLSVHLAGGRDGALAVAGRLKLFTNATSLGGPESLVEHRASVEGTPAVSPQNLLRLSVGLEHYEDLIGDLDQALA